MTRFFCINHFKFPTPPFHTHRPQRRQHLRGLYRDPGGRRVGGRPAHGAGDPGRVPGPAGGRLVEVAAGGRVPVGQPQPCLGLPGGHEDVDRDGKLRGGQEVGCLKR